ncbi:hypothetical protein Tco_1370533 [Tanacetum coccineum]
MTRIIGQPRRVEKETYTNTSPENRQLIDAEAEAIHMILNGITDDIYSTVDACSIAREMWLAIELNVQFLQQLQPEWSRFVIIVKQQQDLDIVSYHRIFDILKQHQNEVNEIRAKKIAKNANPLTLVAAAQHYLDNYSPDTYYHAPKPHKTHTLSSRHTPSTSSHATTRNKGKEIAKPITPPFESTSEEDNDPQQAQQDKDMQKNLALIGKYIKNIYKPINNNLKTSSNAKNKTVDTSPRSRNDRKSGQFRNQRIVTVVGARETECRKPKRAIGYEYHKEMMMLCKPKIKKGSVQVLRDEWLHDTDDEPDKQELKAYYMYMAKIQEVPTADSGPTYDAEPLEKVDSDDDYNVFATDRQYSKQHESINDTYVVETVNSNVTTDSSDMSDNEGQVDQNVEELEDERVLLASLIANFKLDIDKNKKSQNQLKKANTFLTQELEKSKQDLDKSTQELEKSIQDLEKSKQYLSYCKSELEKYKILQTNHNDKEKAELECAKALRKSSFANPLYLKKAQNEKPCLYNVKYDKNDLANLFAPEYDETIHLVEKSRSKFVVEIDWKYRVQNKWQNPISHDVKLLVKDMLIPFKQDTKSNASLYETYLKTEMFADLKYVQSLEKEVDEL